MLSLLLFLAMDGRTETSLQLQHLTEKIMHMWESRVRENVASAPSKSVPVLRNQLPEFLENLIANISSGTSRTNMRMAGQIGKDHGEQRASLLDYTCSQVLSEYRILRQVIFEVLAAEKLLTSQVRDIVLNVLDEGIEKAVEQFSITRSEELMRSNRDLEHFASIAAHDLKSPLATIIGFTELLGELLQDKIGAEEAEYIQVIRRSSARMTLLIDRLLDYSSVGREMKPFTTVHLNQIVKDVIENLKETVEVSQAHIEVPYLPTVYGDASLLSQLFQNLLSNALKFRDPNRPPKIQIRALEREVTWLFSVKDNGSGFDTNDRENIFGLFKRLDSTRAQAGLGIGLATTRKVVELHGGTVWAESDPGVGSTFFFTLRKVIEPVKH